MVPFKADFPPVYTLIMFSICGHVCVQGQANFALTNVARDIVLPLVAPLSAINLYGLQFGGNDDSRDQDDHKPRGPRFPLFFSMDVDSTNLSRKFVREDVANFLAHLSPLAHTKQVIENNVVLANNEFRGLLKVKQVSANNQSTLLVVEFQNTENLGVHRTN